MTAAVSQLPAPPVNPAAERTLFEVLEARRTIRSFAPQAPPEEDVRRVIEAGALAPYPLLGTKASEPFRRYFVLRSQTPAREICERRVSEYAARVTRVFGSKLAMALVRWMDSIVVRQARPARYYSQANALLEQHVENTGHFAHSAEAPYFVIVAELRRGPLLSGFLVRQSLGHLVQNMWLAATAKGLAFQPISMSKILADDAKSCTALGIKPKEWVFDGFYLGYPGTPPAKKHARRSATEDTVWL